MNINDSRFQYAVNVVLEHEGGLSNDKDDKGGITRWGISLRYLELEHIDPNGDGIIDAHDVRGLTKQEAIDIYKAHWWNKYSYNKIKDLRLATKVFDLAVNAGAVRAHKLLQQAIGTTVDGLLGPRTIAITNVQQAGEVLAQLRLEAREFYLGLIQAKPIYEKYRNGWLARAAW
jgi:lysozyme family protein